MSIHSNNDSPIKSFYSFFLIVAWVYLLCFSLPSQASPWRHVAPGIDYLDGIDKPMTRWSHIHVFRIDLNQNQLDVVMAQSFSKTYASAQQFARHSHALISINGGFFDRNSHSLGLRVSHQKTISPIKNISWWSIFYTKAGVAHISSLRGYQHQIPVDFAVQSGPRLLKKGRVTPFLKAGIAERSALGITKDGSVILIVTEGSPISTSDLAHLMRSSPLNCTDALNLDGGSSSQLYARLGKFRVNAPGFSYVSDAIVVKPREAVS